MNQFTPHQNSPAWKKEMADIQLVGLPDKDIVHYALKLMLNICGDDSLAVLSYATRRLTEHKDTVATRRYEGAQAKSGGAIAVAETSLAAHATVVDVLTELNGVPPSDYLVATVFAHALGDAAALYSARQDASRDSLNHLEAITEGAYERTRAAVIASRPDMEMTA